MFGGGSLISPDGVAPTLMVSISAQSCYLPLQHEVQKKFFLLALAHPGSDGNRAIKRCVCVCVFSQPKLFNVQHPASRRGFPFRGQTWTPFNAKKLSSVLTLTTKTSSVHLGICHDTYGDTHTDNQYTSQTITTVD